MVRLKARIICTVARLIDNCSDLATTTDHMTRIRSRLIYVRVGEVERGDRLAGDPAMSTDYTPSSDDNASLLVHGSHEYLHANLS